MAGEWETLPASDFCHSVRDGTHDSPKQTEVGRYLVTSRHITGNRLDLANAYRISQADFDEINRRSKVDRWDVLITMIGTVGEPCLISEEPQFAIKNIGLFKSKSELRGKWLYYLLRSPEYQHHIKAHSRGSTQQYIPLGELRSIPVSFPSDRTEMEAIADILGTLDDKIELNRQMNRTLEAMARAIFKAWFVDFEPVKAKAAGATSFRGMPQAVFDQLPDRFTDTELGPVPEGWGVAPLSDLVELIGGGTPKRKTAEYWDGDIPWFSVRDAPNDGDVWVIDTEEKITKAGVDNSSARVMKAGTSIISARGTVGRLALTAVPMAMNQSCYGVTGRDGVGDFFVYFTLHNAVVELQKRTHGSVFDTITRKTFDGLNRVRPQSEMLMDFEEIVSPYLMKMRANLFENGLLSNIRDTLLPKLISGELQVKDAGRFVGVAN
jgi:type I restriction enzyme S subunit